MNDLRFPNIRSGLFVVICAIALSSMAAGMGWGIRGQYGHETGAMIAGVLTSLVIVLFFIPEASSLTAARAAAMMTVAIGIGGTMTYGQTVGLTHDRDLVGNWEALRWGLMGLFIKGGIWIGFGGAFLGMGLGGRQYRPLEMLLLMLALVGLVFFGIWLINSPHDPVNRLLPKVYFSGSWYFQPDKLDLKPRREVWGGLLVALLGLVFYARMIRQDTLALRMALIGFLAGGLGFSGGQCVQAFHSWNAEMFSTGSLSQYTVFRYFNWWNMMETSFGLIFGAIVATGLWLNRHLINPESDENSVTLSPTVEMLLVVVHLFLLIAAEFIRLPGRAAIIGSYIDFGLIMCVLPMVGIVGGRLWPYLLVLPIVAAPICGKQLRALVFSNEPQFSWQMGTILFVFIPIGIGIVTATWLIAGSKNQMKAQQFSAVALFVNTLTFFGLNTVFFNFAWPWDEWTGRTPNQTIFVLCGLCLSSAAIVSWYRPFQTHN
jgi:hypothetical protein